MVSGYPPYIPTDTRSKQKVYDNIISNEIKLSKKISSELKDLMNRLLQADPTKRLGYNGTSEVMRHSFFKGINWNLVGNKRVNPPYIPKVASATKLR